MTECRCTWCWWIYRSMSMCRCLCLLVVFELACVALSAVLDLRIVALLLRTLVFPCCLVRSIDFAFVVHLFTSVTIFARFGFSACVTCLCFPCLPSLCLDIHFLRLSLPISFPFSPVVRNVCAIFSCSVFFSHAFLGKPCFSRSLF